jgi:hypothetical protein
MFFLLILKEKRMKNVLATTVTIGLLAFAGSAMGNLISNGNFEENGGSLNNWTHNATVTLQQAGVIADIQGMDGHYALLGGETTTATSRLRQDFDIEGIDELTISFDWAFDIVDWSRQDDIFMSIIREGDTNAHKITMQRLRSSAVPQFFGVGASWGHYEETFSISDWLDDEGRVRFSLNEADTRWTNSLAGIDNVSVTGTGPAAVPEPATMLLFGTGLAGLIGYSRKRSGQKS